MSRRTIRYPISALSLISNENLSQSRLRAMSLPCVVFPSPPLFVCFTTLVFAASHPAIEANAAFVGTLRSLEIPEHIALGDVPATSVLEEPRQAV